MDIIFIHHANRDIKDNSPTQADDITGLGYRDCMLTAELLNDDRVKGKLKAVYTSPFLRCRKTAELINTYIKLPIIEDNRLNEFKSVEGESWVECQTRVEDCLNDIVSKYDDNDMVIVVTSGVNLAAFINKAYGIEANASVPFIGIATCSPLIFKYNKR